MELRLRPRIVLALAALLVAAAAPLARSPAAPSAQDVRARYTKYEYQVPMRDGVRLFTSVYVPKDRSQPYPILLTRTPYSVAPYGVDHYRDALGPSEHFQQEGFIFVYQDARGRYMSEGEFQQVRPFVPDKKTAKDIDESTDTWDTIDWMLKHLPNHNGRVGMVGVSQPGFHVAASIIDSHPALKAASPQAPTADYYMGDDVYHNGAFMLGANFGFYSGFLPHPEPQPTRPSLRYDPGTPDMYDFHLRLSPLITANERLFGGRARYWQEIIEHTTYDDYWKKRSVWKFMNNVTCAVLNVGGWFDAEDPVGPLLVYRAVEQKNPKTVNALVMGPWSHGGWSRGPGESLGNLHFAMKTGEFFREQIQFPFFMKHLKDKGADVPEAWMFLTGINEFRRHEAWPPKRTQPLTLTLEAGQRLAMAPAAAPPSAGFDEYLSDPKRPVPFVGYIASGFTRDYMTEDQRFAAQRPDVLVYQTEPLAHDVVIAGPITVNLTVSTTGTDADFVVKLVDVYPHDFPTPPAPAGQPVPANAVKMGGYQQLVRGEPFRGKYRNSFETPEPFVPGERAAIRFDLPDAYHAFRRGHRIMVQIQSSWFPLVDRNPQTFMEIPRAVPADFQKATQRVYHGSSLAVRIEGAAR